MVEFLKRVLVGLRAWHFLDEGDHGDRRLNSFGEWGHQQGGGGAVLGGDDRDAVGNAGIGVGHRAACVFRPISRLLHTELRSDQMEGRGNALAKDDGDPVTLKRRSYAFGDRFVRLDVFHIHSEKIPPVLAV